ncbi:YdeI/OmpD-associated family protein [Granulicella sibirica]|uniref:YdhG-like domain-containing protein n=1 Tax=Granulicella sibirica TaxID=2479048 RepID=A0A4Q0T9Y5_9BACT|nr:YdeI/OmpD-associated family protein [Granulicella sibirica]RXH58576.1 hypothetical protein GRAN_1886 [Granulicella sibirica]
MEDPRVDAYINKSAEFAKPILRHLRKLVHKANGEIEESIKWSRPFFLYRGSLIGNMSAFTAHCSFGVWGPWMTGALRLEGITGDGASGSVGRITRLEDLPSDAVLTGLIREAIKSLEEGKASPKAEKRVPRKAAKAELMVPEDFASALAKTGGATENFSGMAQSCRKEYLEWITEAKRAETRGKRIVQAVTWIAEGKKRNWKYESR